MRVTVCAGPYGKDGVIGDCTLKPDHGGDCESLGSDAAMKRTVAALQRIAVECAERFEKRVLDRVISNSRGEE